MTEKEQKLHDEIAEMQGDIRVVVATLNQASKALGINFKDFQDKTLPEVLPPILGRLTQQLMLGTLDTQSLADFTALLPIINKYQPLVEDIFKE